MTPQWSLRAVIEVG